MGVRTLAALAALALDVSPAAASAGTILQVQNASAQPGGTGSFDVVLVNNAGTIQVSGFSVELSVPAGSGVTLTGVDVNTATAPYIFTTLQAPPLTFATFPTRDFTASDSDMTAPGFVTLTAPPTATVGLEHVTFTVASPTLDVTVPVSIVIGSNTQILDVNANPLPFTATGGTITVGPAAVPSPRRC